jgi:DNA-binding transcriptional LysR family regulator
VDLNVRQVRYLLAVVEFRSFTRAAQRLYISTPSLSQQIGKLEAQLGFRLLDRARNGVTPTGSGQQFISAAREFLRAHDAAVSSARALRELVNAPDAPRLRLGFLAGLAGSRTADILAAVRQSVPGVVLTLTQVDWGDQLAGLTAGSLDAVLARSPLPDTSLPQVPVLREPRVLVLARSHPLATRESVCLADLAGAVQVEAPGASPEWRAWWAIDPRPDGSRPTYGTAIRSMEEMLEVVAASHEVSIAPQSVADAFPRRDLAYLPLVDAPPSDVVLVLPAAPPSEVQRALVAAVTATSVDGTG